MPPMLDLKGKVFGRLSAEERSATSKDGRAMWRCTCSCGRSVVVRSTDLVRGLTKSCGCLQKECSREMGLNNATHKKTGTKEYRAWLSMLHRCSPEYLKDFPRYSGRGIKVCEDWKCFENFLRDMGVCPSDKESIDRYPDNNGDYEPGNCRWATTTQQARNRESSVILDHNGAKRCVVEWSEITGIPTTTIRARLKLGWSVSRALTTIRRPYPSRRKKDACP